ncbi:MAG: amidophosphoribosyltransferase [Cytophagales bacterium]
MSDEIKHECGIALIRLRKSFSYYVQKYGTPFYGLSKLYVMMDKQQNRGQDGAGVAVIKMDTPPGYRYISRYRSIESNAVQGIFEKINKKYKKSVKGFKDKAKDPEWLKRNVAFMGEVLIGHLRYGTHGQNSIENCHPFLRQNNWKSRNLVMAGNFNMTNNDELFAKLIELGQAPKEMTDTVTVMEKIGHFLDEENQVLFNRFKEKYTNREISGLIEETLDLQRVLKRSCKDFDGGYAMAGVTGYGGTFVARDPNGIRPAFFYADDEVVVVASERPAIRIAFGIDNDQIQEIKPGHALIINKDGDYDQYPFIASKEPKKCSFERIYFSRGSDSDIYKERKNLGKLLIPQILNAVDYDLKNTVFSYIPNTAEVAFLGMMEGVEEYLLEHRKKEVLANLNNPEKLNEILNLKPRVEKLVIKDAKLRTFITNDDNRDSMVSMVYDSTFGLVKKDVDNLVIIDDSIVRGTTLEKSILRILDKHKPKRIIIVSSAPQIRYPDCYGIDMSKMKEFVAFRAMMALLKETGKENMLDEVYEKCKAALENNTADKENFVKVLYDQFTDEQISNKVAQIITPSDLHAEVKVVFQKVDNLHIACPDNLGDWYFTGDYPTPGGIKVVNKAFVYFMEGKGVRAY